MSGERLRTRTTELEVTAGIRPIDATGYEHLRVLVRYRGLPLGWLALHGGVRPAEEVREAVVHRFGWLMPRYLAAEGPRTPDSELPAISVVICTRDRPDHLRGALAAATSIDYPRFEVVVVDSASTTDETARVAAAFPVRYVREEVPGLDRARNRGVREARHDIVAFTDDDACADAGWLRAIAEGFERADVGAVAGYVAPLEMDTPAQHLFELVYGGMGHGLHRRSVRRDELFVRELIQASGFGCGANMAFRRSVLEELGGFDPALDSGTPSGGAGDVDMLHRVLAAGHALVYEPAALVWHAHRREMEGLRRQLFDNGRSFGCYLLTCARNRTVSRARLAQFALGTWLWRWLLRRTIRPGRLPRSLVLAELQGALASPYYYLRSRATARRRERQAPPARAESPAAPQPSVGGEPTDATRAVATT